MAFPAAHTAGLFSSSNGSGGAYYGKQPPITKGNSFKIDKSKTNPSFNISPSAFRQPHAPHRRNDSSQNHYHVPTNSHSEHYPFYNDIPLHNDKEVFPRQHVSLMSNNMSSASVATTGVGPGPYSHKHNNSMASNTHHHNTSRLLDKELDIIEGDIVSHIPSQKDIMTDFFKDRVEAHVHTQSLQLAHNYGVESTADTDTRMQLSGGSGVGGVGGGGQMYTSHTKSGTLIEVHGTPQEETNLIGFDELQIEDYDSDEERRRIDPMALIRTKTELRPKDAQFPDTQEITAGLKSQQQHQQQQHSPNNHQPNASPHNKRRKRHNTARTPITPSSIVMHDSDNDDNETYGSSNDSEEPPNPGSHRGSQRLTSLPSTADNTPLGHADAHTQATHAHAAGPMRANTITDFLRINQGLSSGGAAIDKNKQHRKSRSDVPRSIKQSELFNLYNPGTQSDLSKALLGTALKAAKMNQSEIEKKAIKETEKKFKPELQKKKMELTEAQKKNEEQQKQIDDLQRMLEAVKKKQEDHGKETRVTKQLHEKSLEINRLQSMLKFEKQRNQMSSNIVNAAAAASAVPFSVSNIMSGAPVTGLRYSKSTNVPTTGPPPSTANVLIATSATNNTVSLASRRKSAGLLLKKQHSTSSVSAAQNGGRDVLQGLTRLKKRVSQKFTQPALRLDGTTAANTAANSRPYISVHDLKKRKSLPEDMAKKHRRPLWTNPRHKKKRSSNSNNSESEAARKKADESVLNSHDTIPVRYAPPKKRDSSLMLPPNSMPLKPRFADKTPLKRGSWNAGDRHVDNSNSNGTADRGYDKLKLFLQAAQNANTTVTTAQPASAPIPTTHLNGNGMLSSTSALSSSSSASASALSNTAMNAINAVNAITAAANANDSVSLRQLMQHNAHSNIDNTTVALKTRFEDVKSKYDHLLAENEHLRRNNLNLKESLKTFQAPLPNASSSTTVSDLNTHVKPPVLLIKPAAVIQRKPSFKQKQPQLKIVARKRLNQAPTRKLMHVEWMPVENSKIKDTRWRYIDDSDIRIPDEFDELFAAAAAAVDSSSSSSSSSDYKLNISLLDRSSSSLLPRQSEGNLLEHGLSPKRQERVLSVLHKIKLSPPEIREALLNGDEHRMSLQILYHLLEIVPNLNEQKYVQSKMSNGGKNALSDTEQFFYELADVNHLELRLQLWIFKMRFMDAIVDRYHDLHLLHEAVQAIQRSSNLEKLLSIILSFGNYLNVDTCNDTQQSDKYGIHGYQLQSLLKLKDVRATHGGFGLLSFLCKYCKSHAHHKYRDVCVDIIQELRCCCEAGNVNSYECHQKILLVTEELSKFGKSLRKFRKAAIATTTDEDDADELDLDTIDNNNSNNSNSGNSSSTKPYPYKSIQNDLFEKLMRDFLRHANTVCKNLLDLRHKCMTNARILCMQYNFELHEEKIEEFVGIFGQFINDLCRAKNEYEVYEHNLRDKRVLQQQKERVSAMLDRFLRIRPPKQCFYFIKNLEVLEQEKKEKEENKNTLSKLVYEHAILLDQQRANNNGSDDGQQPEMSYQRIKYLKGLAKSNELPNQLSNTPEAIQKQRRRRRSLSQTDIQIGNKMDMTLAEDEELN